MIAFPNCKINLGLNIIRKRADGYHDLETVFYPLPFSDILEIVEDRSAHGNTGVRFTQTGNALPGPSATNLCIQAYDLLKTRFTDLPPVFLHLHKAIPAGAGLGGGSADASFTLKMLNTIFKLGLTEEELLILSLKLGSDCPFFIVNQPSFATALGEKLEPCAISLKDFRLLLVYPGIHVDTARAFAHIRPSHPEHAIKDLIQEPVETWRETIYNDFEPVIARQHKEISELKAILYRSGALYASMTGSGSSVYGIFRKDRPIVVKLPATWMSKELICEF